MGHRSIRIVSAALLLLCVSNPATSSAANLEGDPRASCFIMFSAEKDANGINPQIGEGCSDGIHTMEQIASKRLEEFAAAYAERRGYPLGRDEVVGSRTLGYAGYKTNGQDGHRLYVSYINNDPGDCDEKGYRVRLNLEASGKVKSFVGATESPACNRITIWHAHSASKRDDRLPVNDLGSVYSNNVGKVVFYNG